METKEMRGASEDAMKTLGHYLASARDHYPKTEAVKHKDRSVTYAELDRESDAVAATLRQGGIRSGDRVAIWLSKSIRAVVAIYGTLKCGAAYVPLDPAAPPDRITYILRDCSASVLVTSQDRLDLLGNVACQETALRTVVLADEGDAALASVGGTNVMPWPKTQKSDALPNPPGAEDPDQLAYILYTSGSTGAPKGVMLSHRNARAFVDWVHSEFGLFPGDRLSNHAPLHFDLSILDIFGAASAAATVVLVPESKQALGSSMNKLVVDEEISVWYSVPTALKRMVEAKNSDLLESSSLRAVLFAGEVFPIKHLRRLRDAVPSAELHNLYGPTETNVCTFYRVREEDLSENKIHPPPIGVACPYATAFLLDDKGALVAPREGAEGELCIGGDSVMIGYWDNSSKTERRMVDYPDAVDAEGLAYRTGDLVRYDRHLDYVFVGRQDDMVKVRGYRIELGEVEAALLGHPAVEEAACIVVSDNEDADMRLEAYVLATQGASMSETGLRAHCKNSLPYYMLPEKFHVLDELPRTSTGKINRRELAGKAKRRDAGGERSAPQSAVTGSPSTGGGSRKAKTR